MNRRRNRSARHAAEFALAVPAVVAHRLQRLAASGLQPTARDRVEFQRMVAEKGEAFAESWQAMALAAGRAQQAFAWSWMGTLMRWPLDPQAAGRQSAAAFQRAAAGVLASGFAPVRQRAVANARRLGRRTTSR